MLSSVKLRLLLMLHFEEAATYLQRKGVLGVICGSSGPR